MVSDQVDRIKDWLYSGDVANVGKRTEIDQGIRGGCRLRIVSDSRNSPENLELKRANEILRKASAYFAQAELDRRPKQW